MHLWQESNESNRKKRDYVRYFANLVRALAHSIAPFSGNQVAGSSRQGMAQKQEIARCAMIAIMCASIAATGMRHEYIYSSGEHDWSPSLIFK